MSTASRIVLGIAAGVIILTVCVIVGLQIRELGADAVWRDNPIRKICGIPASDIYWLDVQNHPCFQVFAAGGQVCLCGSPIWGVLAFVLTFFLLPKEKKPQPANGS